MDLKFSFLGVNYYDGQGFMIRKDMGVSSASELDGATVCIQTGTTTELNLADFFRANNMNYEPVPIETNAEAQQKYLANACDVYTTDASGLAATRATFEDPETTSSCRKSSPRSRSDRWSATATMPGVTSCAGC